MQVFELHFNPKGQKDVIYDSFCYEPENIYERRLGNLYIAGQLSRSIEEYPHFLDNLANALKEKYYSHLSRSPAVALVESLKQGNKFLSEFIKQGNVGWLGNLDFAIFTVKETKFKTKSSFAFHFTKVGNIKIFLIRKGAVVEIGGNLDSQDIDPYPLKIFFKVASGKLEEQDRIVILTSQVSEKNPDLLKKIAGLNRLDETNIKAMLDNQETLPQVPEAAGICLLTVLGRNDMPPQTLTLQRELPQPSPLSRFKALSAISTSSLKKAAALFQGKGNWAKRIGTAAPFAYVPAIFTASIAKVRPHGKKIKTRMSKTLLSLRGRSRIKKKKLKRKSFLKGVLGQRKILILFVCFIVMLAIGAIIFTKEESNQVKIDEELFAQIEQKALQAENFLILKNTEKANLLFQEAWKKLLLQTATQARLPEKATELKNSIEEKLITINKLETITEPRVATSVKAEQIRSLPPHISAFRFSQQSVGIYFLNTKSGKIIKHPYSLTLGWGRAQPWVQEAEDKKAPDITGAKSIAIDGSIWVLGKDSSLHRYHKGAYQETFRLNIFPTLVRPAKIWTSPDHSYLYLLEPSQNRIIILTKQGQIVKQFQSEKFNNLVNFAVSANEKTIWLLSGPTVYRLEI